jgi:hypothetical protein
MQVQELFVKSNEALLKPILLITDEQWSIELLKGMSRQPMNLKQAVQYHTYDDAWVADVLAGKTIEEVGKTYDYLKDNDDVKVNYKKYNKQAINAVANFNNLDKTVHLSYGDYPAGEYILHIVSFRAFRSYDISKLIGADTKMDDDFVQGLIEHFTPVIEGYRQMGVFPPALSVSPDATPQQKLLAMAGRE